MEAINVLPGNKTTTLPRNTFTRDGWSFKEWNTDQYGKGTKYEDGATIENIEENITLYAIWEEDIKISLSVTNNKIVEDTKMSIGAEAITGVQNVELKVGENKLYTQKYDGSKIYEKNNLAVENLEKTAFEKLPFYEIELEVTVITTAGNTKTKTFASKNYTIGNAEALERFAEVVDEGKTLSGETIYLLKDLTVGTHTPIGTWDLAANTLGSSKCFSGIFEGNEHTITISSYVEKSGIGLFGAIRNATVKNITVTATIPYGRMIRSE